MAGNRAKKRRARQLEAQFEKANMRRTHFSASGAQQQPKPNGRGKDRDCPQRQESEGLTRDMKKMLSMKRAMDRKEGRAQGSVKMSAEFDSRAYQPREAEAPPQESLPATQFENKAKRTRVHPVEDGKTLSASKQRKKEYLRSKKGKRGSKPSLNGADGVDGEHGSSDPHCPQFGEQAEAPMKEQLRRKHWVNGEGSAPGHANATTSIVGLNAPMGRRRVAGMDSRALAQIYRDQRKNKTDENEYANKATMQSLKVLVRHGTEHNV